MNDDFCIILVRGRGGSCDRVGFGRPCERRNEADSCEGGTESHVGEAEAARPVSVTIVRLGSRIRLSSNQGVWLHLTYI